jgi:hypothetical protein
MNGVNQVNRTLEHHREVNFKIYAREDGLWDIEGRLLDTKTRAHAIPNYRSWNAGQPIHEMVISITLDSSLNVVNIEVLMNSFPLMNCHEAIPPMAQLVNKSLAYGWRKSVDDLLSGVNGCTHLRELLYSFPTAAFQGVTGFLSRQKDSDTPPAHLGRCVGWSFSGPAVLRFYPKFHTNKGGK